MSELGRTITKKFLKDTVAQWCEDHITIHDIEEGTAFPLRWNELQLDFVENSKAIRLHPVTDGSVKYRQGGFSVCIGALVISLMKHVPGIVICWVNLDEDGSRIIRRKIEMMWKSTQASIGSGFPGVRYDSDDQLILDNGSVLMWAEAGAAPTTAGKAGVGDTIDLLILTELARWEYAEKTLVALKPAVESTKGGIIIDSTPPEFQGQGAMYMKMINGIRNKSIPGHLFFWPWWFRYDYRMDLPAEPPYTKKEVWLMTVKDLDMYQLAWRRKQLSDPIIGSRFKFIYPESIVGALSPKGKSVFDLSVMTALEYKYSTNSWPTHLEPQQIQDALPPKLSVSRSYDPLKDPSICRIYQAPRQAPPRIPETEKRALLAAQGGDSYAKEIVLRAERRRGAKLVHNYWIGVDASDGTATSNNQGVVVVDSSGRKVAIMRCKLNPIVFASHVARLCLWYNATSLIEINARSGMQVYEYLKKLQRIENIREMGAHPCLENVIPKVHKLHSDARIRPAIYEQFLSALNDADNVMCPWEFEEMQQWDLEKKKARSGSVDDLLDANGLAYYCRKEYPMIQKQDFNFHVIGRRETHNAFN